MDELLDELEKSLDRVELNDEEMRCLRELREYALGEEGSWVLSDDFLNLIGMYSRVRYTLYTLLSVILYLPTGCLVLCDFRSYPS